ncbi:PEP-CTERM sorting domain-containing protein [bacterium]|nr:MAG: PEP-CTERM sorting domain-containing protein [bacterium]
MKPLKSIVHTAFLLAFATSANAASVLITNHSFESPTLADDNNAGLADRPGGFFNGWGYFMTSGSSFQDFGIENVSGGAYTGAAGSGTPFGGDGTNVAFLNQGITGGLINIFQDVGTLLPNTQYTLTVAIGQRLDRINGSATIGLINAAFGEDNAWADGILLNSTTAVSSVSGSFEDFTTTFTTGSTVSGNLYIGAQYVGDGTIQASVDNFRLEAIPEPSAAALLAFGVLGVLRRRRA